MLSASHTDKTKSKAIHEHLHLRVVADRPQLLQAMFQQASNPRDDEGHLHLSTLGCEFAKGAMGKRHRVLQASPQIDNRFCRGQLLQAFPGQRRVGSITANGVHQHSFNSQLIVNGLAALHGWLQAGKHVRA